MNIRTARWIKNFTRSSLRIILTWVILVSIVITTSILTYNKFNTATIEFRKRELEHLVTLGLNLIAPIREQYDADLISKEAALEQIKDSIRLLVYNDEETRNYLFMSSYDGIMLVQPFEPQLEGTSQWDLQDTDGTYIIRELVKQAKSGSGFVHYYYYPPDRKQPELKISYVVGLEDFSCYIGSGMYIYDIKASLNQIFGNYSLILMVVLLSVLFIPLLLLRPYLIAYQLLRQHFNSMISDPDFQPPEQSSVFRKKSEPGMLMQDFSTMVAELSNSRFEMAKTLNEKKVLLREVHHRVKNNLQIILSLLNLQIMELEDEQNKDLFKDSIQRIQVMALLHETIFTNNLENTVNMHDYLHDIAESILQEASVDLLKIKRQFNFREEYLGISQAILCGIILNELISNILKKHFREPGQKTLYLTYRHDNSEASIIVFYADSEYSTHASEQNKTLNTTIIEALALQLNGNITLDISKGYRFTVKFPVNYQ